MSDPRPSPTSTPTPLPRAITSGAARLARRTSAVFALLGLLAAWFLSGTDFGADQAAPASTSPAAAPALNDPALIARGAYLARVGNCAACHTARGDRPYVGGRGIDTPFGTVYSGNLTPDLATGLGAWSADDFWRAMHLGRSRDGRALLPAFPYTEMTLLRREDSDALFAYLRSLTPVARAPRAHALRFPYNQPIALQAWRALYFTPGTFEPAPERSAEWNRGAYLVRGLGHCASCHAPRDALGGVRDAARLGGGRLPDGAWFAPPLGPDAPGAASVEDTVELLAHGHSARGVAAGPMAEVVGQSSQHWTDADRRAVAVYLGSLPPGPRPDTVMTAPADAMALGQRVYTAKCADCHGDQGEGARTAGGVWAVPPLAGNASVQQADPVNLIQAVLHGGFGPVTARHPQPFGMPPSELSDAEVAAVLSHVRQRWGNAAAPVSALDVLRQREAAGD